MIKFEHTVEDFTGDTLDITTHDYSQAQNVPDGSFNQIILECPAEVLVFDPAGVRELLLALTAAADSIGVKI